jgi:F-box protein 9
MEQTEKELEAFRSEWKKEVIARSRNHNHSGGSSAGPSTNSPEKSVRRRSVAPPPSVPLLSTHSVKDHVEEGGEGYEARSFHDLEEKGGGVRLGDAGSSVAHVKKEPATALEHYEAAVEKETMGRLGDSLALYRKAFRV